MTEEQITQFKDELEKIIDRFEPLMKLSPEIESKLKELKERLELINAILGAYIAISQKSRQILDIMSYAKEACPGIEEVMRFIMEKVKPAKRGNNH